MKTFFLQLVMELLVCVCYISVLRAQSPETMSYQAVIRDVGDNLVINQSVGMQISILQSSAKGTAVYIETHISTTNTNGLVSVEIGGGTVVSGNFAVIDWANGPYFIKTETDPSGGTDYSITGTSQLLSVPYALHAKTVGEITEKQGLANVMAINNSANDQIKNLTDPTELQDAATKAYVDAIKEVIYNDFLNAGLNGIVKDVDGNTYKTIKIGEQVWMAENLRTTKYNDGTAIPFVTSNSEWSNLNTPGYCWYNNDSVANSKIYGALYNWYTVETNQLCPTGWHVSTESEWITLYTYLGGDSIAGGMLKDTGTIYWISPNTGATNEIGFTVLPNGNRDYNSGTFSNLYQFGYFWSATDYNVDSAWFFELLYNSKFLMKYGTSIRYGFGVRCIRD